MNERVRRLYELLMEHDREEQGLVHDIRRYGYLPESRWAFHDELERRTLYVMATMTREEITEADDRYENDTEDLF